MVKDWEQGHHSRRGISAALINSTVSLWKGPSGNEAFGVTGKLLGQHLVARKGKQ